MKQRVQASSPHRNYLLLTAAQLVTCKVSVMDHRESTWQDSEPPRRQTSGHVCEGLSNIQLPEVGRATLNVAFAIPCCWIQRKERNRNQNMNTITNLSLFHDWSLNVTRRLKLQPPWLSTNLDLETQSVAHTKFLNRCLLKGRMEGGSGAGKGGGGRGPWYFRPGSSGTSPRRDSKAVVNQMGLVPFPVVPWK